MKNTSLEELSLPYELKSHNAFILKIDSQALKNNPLKDPSHRHNYVLAPKGDIENPPVIFHLSGYFSTGYQNFTAKTLNLNFVQKLDQQVVQKKAPAAVHVFVEATTYWGGSQFINSPGCGQYSDYILKELYPAVVEQFAVSSKATRTCVMGGSSGGYGALALVSVKGSPFGVAFATAPDSYFEASLLPELFKVAPELLKYKSLAPIKKKIAAGELQEKKSFFNLANALAMAHCYSPKEAFRKDFLEFPIDLHTGRVKSKLWKSWLKHDPVHFLKARKKNLQGKQLFIDVGKYDNFCLQFGARQIAEVLKEAKVKHSYTEFPGNHFGLSERRLGFLEKLATSWKSHV